MQNEETRNDFISGKQKLGKTRVPRLVSLTRAFWNELLALPGLPDTARFTLSVSKVCDYLLPEQIPNFILGISYQVYYKLHNYCKLKTLHGHVL